MIARRAFLRDLGRVGFAVVVLGACSGEPDAVGDDTTETDAGSQPAGTSAAPTEWAQVALPATAAYLLARNGEVALVDTGPAGSAGVFDEVLTGIGLDWSAVGEIIVTHHHPDHSGGMADLAARAPSAAFHVGAADLPAVGPIDSVRPRAVADGDRIFDLTIIGTPGHTPGHISVLDEAAGILVAGDAVNNTAGLQSASADVRFTDDGPLADESVRKLAGFDFEILLMGHGDPIVTAASSSVGDLAASL